MADGPDKARMPTTVRLPEAVEDAVRTSAQQSGRSLTAELRTLIERGLSGERPDDDLFGLTPSHAAFTRSLGDAIARLAFDVDEWTVGSDPDAPWTPGRYSLVALAAAVEEFLSAIGPDETLNDAEKASAQEVGRGTGKRLVAAMHKALAAEGAAGGFPEHAKRQAFLADLGHRLGLAKGGAS
jgi:hypothetical protein